MRWNRTRKPEPSIGDTRIVFRFLWLPRTIADETRWLENAYIAQEYRVCGSCSYGAPHAVKVLAWRDCGWATDAESDDSHPLHYSTRT